MNLIELEIPDWTGAEVVFNSLYDVLQPSVLTQDTLLVSLPNDVFIDVGWYPERDPSGSFRVNVYRRDWDNQLLSEPVRTRDPNILARNVEQLVRKFAETPTCFRSYGSPTGFVATSNTGSVVVRYPDLLKVPSLGHVMQDA